jgi:peptidoglycan hydrolase FlgJ
MSELSIPTVDPVLYGSIARSSQNQGLSAAVAGAAKASNEAEVDRLLGEFQNVMFNEMMKAMRESVPKSGLFEDEESAGRDIFESLLDEQYAASLGKGMGSLGLTEVLKAQLGLKPDLSVALPPATTEK